MFFLNYNKFFQLTLKLLLAMVFLSPDNIVNLWPDVKFLKPTKCQNIIVWFKESYINGRKRRPSSIKSVVTPPIYNPQIWTVRSNWSLTNNKQCLRVKKTNGKFQFEIIQRFKITKAEIIVVKDGAPAKKKVMLRYEPKIINLLNSGILSLTFLQGMIPNINI